MSVNPNSILYGPKSNYAMPEVALGNYFFEILKKRDHDEVINIDAFTNEKLTCGQLLKNSIKLALTFEKLGLKRGDIISIVSENHVRYFEPVLAAFYLGITINGLNPAYTANELCHSFLQSKPKLVLCTELSKEAVLDVTKDFDFIQKVLLMYNRSSTLESLEEFLDSEVGVQDFLPTELDYYDDVAFILSSSGTTGLPKGTMITHRNVRVPIGYKCDPNLIGITSRDVIVLVPPFFHAFGIIMYFSALFIGAKLVVLKTFKPDVFLKTIQDHKPMKLFVVPPMLVFLAKSPLVDNYDLSSIKDIWSGAAPAGKELFEEVQKRLASVTIRQTYGLTETTGPCTIQMDTTKIGSVGKIIPDSVLKIRDPDTHKILGSYQKGELCIKGPMVVKGYIRNEEATRNSFDEDGFLCSGDLGYYDNHGYIYIVDRLKELIKCKGFQVAPAELEALIVTHPDVEDCGVIGVPDKRAGEVPLAFIVSRGSDLTEQMIIDYVAGRISVQKHLYGGVRFVKEIPKTPSGKILRRKLMELYVKS